MSYDHYHRFNLAYAPFFVRKRVGKCFKVLRRFPTHEQALDYLRSLTELYPGTDSSDTWFNAPSEHTSHCAAAGDTPHSDHKEP